MNSGDLNSVEIGRTPSRANLTLALIPGVGPTILNRLLDHFGDPESVLGATGIDLTKVNGVGGQLAQKIIEAHHTINVDGLLEVCRQNEIQILTPSTPAFPHRLKKFTIRPIYCLFKARCAPKTP